MSKRWLIFLCFFGSLLHAVAQQKPVDGVVFDKDSKERIAKVNIVNARTKESIYNNLQAEFHINVKIGDQLIFSKVNYANDTVTVKNTGSIAVYLKATSIMLKQVDIHDTLKTPLERYQATQRDYTKIYGSLGNRSILSTSPYGGAGISIDAIWNMISRSGRNAERLKGIIERDYHENIIDYRFNKTLVGNITGLTEPKLSEFMLRYRPGYYMVVTASDYDFIASIKANYRRYLRSPNRRYTLPVLPHIVPDDEKK
ncbi:carboxypeptidase-like regulatory domain-containing protein [Mucilaginibacter agri]|uniref:Uncharacterized protein n=1 Tax=Mucilaginibacter agri TaxID=2695265 RepID=A0A965ZE64_9SPHI|nr:carboxypeptidase-like regulatory domain-containing protein [Mucilaginibacter agri]NCD69409.1 hypothetical protein [Mucilaginibacter agri]